MHAHTHRRKHTHANTQIKKVIYNKSDYVMIHTQQLKITLKLQAALLLNKHKQLTAFTLDEYE